MNNPKKPIVIVQFSCDPYLLYNTEEIFDKEIESQRMKSDLIARHNAITILKHAPKRQRIRKTIKQIEKDMATNLKQEGIYEDEVLSPRKKSTLREMRLSSDMRSHKSSIDVKHFYRTLTNPNTQFYYLPIHASHPKDFQNLKQDEYFIELPDKMYVITLTPMNTKALFFNNQSENKQFFDYLTSLTGYTRIRSQRNKTILPRIIHKSLRIWSPGDIMLNREIQSDREHQPLRRHGRKPIERLPRALYRNTMNSQMDKLYNDIVKQQGLRKTKRKKGGKRLSRKEKIAHWKKNTAKKYSHSKNKTGYSSDCSGYISYMWDIPLTDKGGLTTLRTADWFKYSKPIGEQMLQSGDAVLLPGKHVIMFDKWANKQHDTYWGYQMCNKKGCRGFTYMKIPFPYSKTRRPEATAYILLRKNT
jgi:hypothetical protein